ncbi:hypothetical protein GE061_003963 [Apolygus lucorum]|uniref:Uncharacterized protein n=1 Tax=Apolygus lucorum TaxID=248454 RepID=A0A8S9WZP4_APOLU|nr:hypothetical protein GE061_003963 [Apolygus lucorum]
MIEHPSASWPTGIDAVNAGLVECGVNHERFLVNCSEATFCHKVTWESKQYTPIRFCFPRKTQCDTLLLRLNGDAICNECSEDRCND